MENDRIFVKLRKTSKHLYIDVTKNSNILRTFSTLNYQKSEAGKVSFLVNKVADFFTEKKIMSYQFDRSGYLFHGVVKNIAISLQEKITK